MKKTIFLVAMLLISSTSYAVDGEIYFGYLSDSTLRAHPDGGFADYASGIELGHFIYKKHFRPYTKIDFLMNSYNDGFFHPSSVWIELGLQFNIYDWLYFEGSSVCWHGIDGTTYINREAYRMLKVGIKFGK